MTYKTGMWGEQAKERQRRRMFNQSQRKYNKKLRDEVLVKLGDRCVMCGYSDPRALHIDHVNDDGYEERKVCRSIGQRMKAVLQDKDGRYQILCANCNFIKKYEVNKKKWGELKNG